MLRQSISSVAAEWLNIFFDTHSLPVNTDVKGYRPNYVTYSSLLPVCCSDNNFRPIPFNIRLSKKKKPDHDFCVRRHTMVFIVRIELGSRKRRCVRQRERGLSWCTGGLNSLTLQPHTRGPSTAHQLQKLAFLCSVPFHTPLRQAAPPPIWTYQQQKLPE